MKTNLLHRWPSMNLGILTTMIFLLTACAGIADPPGRLDPDFGENYRNAFSSQAINPMAPVDSSPAATLPGELANQIYKKRYVKPMTEEKKEKEDASSELSSLD